jgi:hypothetical protein
VLDCFKLNFHTLQAPVNTFLLLEMSEMILINILFLSSVPRIEINKTNSVAFSPQANYTDETAALIGEVTAILCGLMGVPWSAQLFPTAIHLGFLHRNLYFFIRVAPQLSLRG